MGDTTSNTDAKTALTAVEDIPWMGMMPSEPNNLRELNTLRLFAFPPATVMGHQQEVRARRTDAPDGPLG